MMRIAVPDRTSFLAIDMRDGIVVVDLELAPGSHSFSSNPGPNSVLLPVPSPPILKSRRTASERAGRRLLMTWAGAMLASFVAGAVLFHGASDSHRAVAAAATAAPLPEELGMPPLTHPTPPPPLAVPEAHPESNDFGLD